MMQSEGIMQKQDRENLKTIYYCLHCREEIGMTKRVYCNECRLVADRREMDANNEKIRQGLHVE